MVSLAKTGWKESQKCDVVVRWTRFSRTHTVTIWEMFLWLCKMSLLSLILITSKEIRKNFIHPSGQAPTGKLGWSFQPALIAPQINLMGYDTAAAQSSDRNLNLFVRPRRLTRLCDTLPSRRFKSAMFRARAELAGGVWLQDSLPVSGGKQWLEGGRGGSSQTGVYVPLVMNWDVFDPADL